MNFANIANAGKKLPRPVSRMKSWNRGSFAALLVSGVIGGEDQTKRSWWSEMSSAMRWEFGVFGILVVVTVAGK